ncbi:nitrate reductase molybdenum cofactor assembly chaperone [Streptomyces shenzhenensis]|uniref:nitrate reductase molybdenum cofactor assembly chaperone n=1 Tax=Streptomyces shenzhenensis TaxID=943815 RepID=UPI001F33AA07|nr:nitrate reductase molybdenum cofactor assembly chaperone [Streptomyces shenzhenensis]
MPSDAVFYQAAALCLTYPDDDFIARLPLLREAAPQLREFTDHATVTPPPELAAHYVQVFDSKNRHSLHLSRWRDDDTRRRGMSLVRLQDVYKAYGMEFTGEELPDFLPAVLEFTARTGNTGLLTEHRDCLARLRCRLTDFGTPYASVLDAVCAALPTGPGATATPDTPGPAAPPGATGPGS